jgi:hypothetical protein
MDDITINYLDDGFYGSISQKMMEIESKKQPYGSFTLNKPFINNIFFNIKNKSYEIVVMWSILIITIILLFCLLLKDANDEIEVERVL